MISTAGRIFRMARHGTGRGDLGCVFFFSFHLANCSLCCLLSAVFS